MKYIYVTELMYYLEKEYQEQVWNNGIDVLYKMFGDECIEITVDNLNKSADILNIIMTYPASGRFIEKKLTVYKKDTKKNTFVKCDEIGIKSDFILSEDEKDIYKDINLENIYDYYKENEFINRQYSYVIRGRNKKDFFNIHFTNTWILISASNGSYVNYKICLNKFYYQHSCNPKNYHLEDYIAKIKVDVSDLPEYLQNIIIRDKEKKKIKKR